MITSDQYLKTALQTVKKAGKIFKRYFGRPKNVRIKEGNWRNFVTEADLKIEKLIRREIKKNFPSHKIIGEELGQDNANGSELCWVIDPIDGTANFIHGIPFCCISVALWDRQGPLAAVVSNPVTNDLYTAQQGKGAYLNNSKIFTSQTKGLNQAFGTGGWGRDVKIGMKIFPWLISTGNKARTFGSAALELCKVADGSIDFFVHGSIKFWDVAAAMLILQEAGGKITDWNGNKLKMDLSRFVADNGKLHRELLKKIQNVKE